MENVSATTLTDYTIHDQRAHRDYASDGLIAHELAHQWWGDLLTCRDWSHAWLNEGFATYFENAYQGIDKGRNYAAYEMLGDQGSVIGSDVGTNRRPTVTNRYIDVDDIFDNRIYAKGACILHMLRFVLGDQLFWKSIRHYVHKHAFQNVETNDFKIAIEEATGRNLHWFFDQWVYNAGYPEFEITSRWDSLRGLVDLTVKQVQQERDSLSRVFSTPAAVEIWSGGQPRTERIMISQVEEIFPFACDGKPDLVVFDKGNWILKKASFQKSVAEWLYQLKHAEMIDRVLAVRELQTFVDSAEVRRALSEMLLQDSVWQIRVEAARVFGASKDDSAATVLMEAYADIHPRVREAVVAELASYHTPEVLALLQRAYAQDSSDAVAAAALRAIARIDTLKGWELCLHALSRDSHGERIRVKALRTLAERGDEEALRLVKDYTRYGVPREIRTEAVAALARTWHLFDDVADYLITLLDDPSFHVRRAVIDALGAMPARQAIEPLRRKVGEESDARMRRSAREAIVKIKKRLNNTSH
jgi:aminopeptidase N